jgi:hypothetical protein
MPYEKIQKFRNMNFSPFSKINCVLYFSKHESNKPKYQMAPNYLEHALAKFEKISQMFDTILA